MTKLQYKLFSFTFSFEKIVVWYTTFFELHFPPVKQSTLDLQLQLLLQLLLLFTPLEFFTSVLVDGLSLESE